jgi:CheY-like chemotaxis protein
MGGLNGDAFATTILALAANAMESDRKRCLAAGMDDNISKPFKQQDLSAVFERWLARAGVAPDLSPGLRLGAPQGRHR